MGEGYVLTANMMRWFRDLYLGRRGDAQDWRASPLRALNHSGLPPALILTCGFDPLSDEGVDYAGILTRAGVPVTHWHLADQVHGFLQWGGVIDASNRVIAECAAMLRRML